VECATFKEFKMATAKSDEKKRKHSKSLDLTRHQRFEATRGPRNFRPEWQANFPWVEVEEKDGKESTALKSHQTRHLKFHIDLYYCCHVLVLYRFHFISSIHYLLCHTIFHTCAKSCKIKWFAERKLFVLSKLILHTGFSISNRTGDLMT